MLTAATTTRTSTLEATAGIATPTAIPAGTATAQVPAPTPAPTPAPAPTSAAAPRLIIHTIALFTASRPGRFRPERSRPSTILDLTKALTTASTTATGTATAALGFPRNSRLFLAPRPRPYPLAGPLSLAALPPTTTPAPHKVPPSPRPRPFTLLLPLQVFRQASPRPRRAQSLPHTALLPPKTAYSAARRPRQPLHLASPASRHTRSWPARQPPSAPPARPTTLCHPAIAPTPRPILDSDPLLPADIIRPTIRRRRLFRHPSPPAPPWSATSPGHDS